MDEASTRRRLLASVCVAGVASVAGCLTGGDGPDDDGTGADGGTTDTDDGTADTDGAGGGGGRTDDTGTAATTGSDDGTTAADDLDLQEANVVGVELESASGGTRFSVTLFHDDDGEDGYADWWSVETPDGEELGRRDLSHAHGTQEFTRSATISVPAEVSCVVVRGHDQTHEYGGRAAVVTVDAGARRFVDQGPDPQSFADAACP